MPLDEEETQQALTSFIFGFSHDAVGANNLILGVSEVILEGKLGSLNEKQKESLSFIQQQSVYLRTLFYDFLWVMNVLRNQIDPSITEINLDEFIPQIFEAARDRSLIQYHRIDPSLIEQRIPDKLPSIWMDSQWIQQAVISVLSEVIGATDGNQEGRKVLLTVSHDDTSVRFNISALGEYQRSFHNAQLVLAQAVAEQHNGQMEVRKTDTHLEVILTLPISKNRPVSS